MEEIVQNINAQKKKWRYILLLIHWKILEEKCANAVVTIDEIGPVIGGHLGPRGIGVCFKY